MLGVGDHSVQLGGSTVATYIDTLNWSIRESGPLVNLRAGWHIWGRGGLQGLFRHSLTCFLVCLPPLRGCGCQEVSVADRVRMADSMLTDTDTNAGLTLALALLLALTLTGTYLII